MVSAYSYRADGSVQNVHLTGCSLVSGSHLVCTCAAIEEEQKSAEPEPDEWSFIGAQLNATMTKVSEDLHRLALVMKLHRWLTGADQVVGMTVPVPVVHRLAEPVRGLLVQVDLRRGRPPYVVLRDDHGAEIPVQAETVRKFLPPIPVPPEEAVQFATLERVSLPDIVEAARRVLKTPVEPQSGAPVDPTGGWCAPTDVVVRDLDPGHLTAVRETEEVGG